MVKTSESGTAATANNWAWPSSANTRLPTMPKATINANHTAL